MPQDARVQLFPNFRLLRDGESVPVSLHSARQVIALLCLHPGREWSRSELGRLIWPDAPGGTHLTRLRTALVQAREVLEPHATLIGDKHRLTLEPGTLQCDLWEARRLVRRVRTAIDAATEENAIHSLLDLIRDGIMREEEADWIIPERQIWLEHANSGGLRLAALAQERGDDQAALQAIEAILAVSPYEERAWTALIRLHSRAGRQIEVCDRFDAARLKLRKDFQGKFSAALLVLAASARKGVHSVEGLVQSDQEMTARTFARMLQDAPEEAAVFLGSNAFRLEVFRDPKRACDLLEKVIERTSGWTEARLACATYAVGGYGILQNHQRLRELGTQVLEHDQNHARRRSVASALAFANFQIRDWDAAYAYGQLAVEEAKAIGDPTGYELARAQMASFDWHQGKFDEALQTYESALAVLKGIDTHHSLAGQTSVILNMGFVHFFRYDFNQAEQLIRQSLYLAKMARHSGIQPFADPTLGAILVAQGQSHEGRMLLASGISMAHRQKDDRLLENVLELAALALAHEGEGAKAVAVVERVTEFRQRSRHLHSPAEKGLIGDIRRLSATEPDPDWLRLTTRREVASAVVAIFSA